MSVLLEDKDIVELGEKALKRKVEIPLAKALVHIDASADGVAVFGFEGVCQRDKRYLATYCTYVQVFFVDLWCAVATGVAQAQDNWIDRCVTDIGTRREDGFVQERMLLQATTYEDRPLFVFPLVLNVSTSEMYALEGVAVVAKNLIAELVVGVFRTCAKVSIHDATWIREAVLCTSHRHDIGRFSIGVGIVVGAEIAITSDMLEASINAYKVLIVSGVHIPFGCSRVDVMPELLGEWRLVWLEAINAITATAKLGGMVVFRSNLGIVGCLEIRAEANRCGVEVWDVGIAIVVSVVLLAVALYAKEEESCFLVFRHDTGVHIGVDIVGASLSKST